MSIFKQTPEQRISKSRSQLLLSQPWFGTLGMRLEFESKKVGTMATDGTYIFYDTEFVEKLEDDEIKGVIAHKIMHSALRHMYRRGSREPRLWNSATDYVINNTLIEAGFKLPQGGLIDKRFHNMSSEQVYAILEAENFQGSGEGATGYFMDAPKEGLSNDDGNKDKDKDGDSPGSGGGDQGDDQEEEDGKAGGNGVQRLTETDWEIAVEQATQIAKKHGKLPGSIESMVKQARETDTNWRQILKRFVQNLKPTSMSWSRPNRRLLHMGIYIPGVIKESMPSFAIAIDTSGSITEEVLQIFTDEINGILSEGKPENIQVIYCDAKVQKVEYFQPEDDVKLTMPGRGGTAFNPVFELLDKQDAKPSAIIYLTDMENGGEQVKDIGIPTLWVMPETSRRHAPFGEEIRLSKFQ